MQDQDALVPATRDMHQLKVLRFDGCGVSTLAAYRLLKTCPDTQLQCWQDGELLFLLLILFASQQPSLLLGGGATFARSVQPLCCMQRNLLRLVSLNKCGPLQVLWHASCMARRQLPCCSLSSGPKVSGLACACVDVVRLNAHSDCICLQSGEKCLAG